MSRAPVPANLLALLLAVAAPVAAAPATPSEGSVMSELPAPVAQLVAAVTAGDTDAFLALFPADGVVDDWGRRFSGHAAIRRWSDKEFIGAKGVLTPRKISRSGDTVTVDAGWKSSYYSGDSRFVFVLDGDSIREMRIVGH